MVIAIVLVATLPWAFAALALWQSRGLLRAFTDFWQSNRIIGGEPAMMADRRLALAEKDAALNRELVSLKAEQDRRNEVASMMAAGFGGPPDAGIYQNDPMPTQRPENEGFDGRS